MKLTFEAFARPLFGPRYQGAVRALLVSGIVFFGLRLAGLRWSLPPSHPLSPDNSLDWGHPVAVFGRRGTLPQPGKPLYAARFLADLCVLLCRRPGQPYPSHQKRCPSWRPCWRFLFGHLWPLGSLLCGVHGVLVTAALFVQRTWVVGGTVGRRRGRPAPVGWNRAGALPGSGRQQPAGRLVPVAHGRVRLLPAGEARLPRHRFYGRPSLGRYLVRYLLSHKNYLVNTGILWGMAWVLPLFFRQVAGVWMAPLGFALLSFNTPMGILLSCDPSSQQAIRFLPGQRRTFCFPYSLFLCACHLVAEGFFLGSWQLQIGGVSGPMLAAAVFFALESAILAVLLEWFFPIRSWKTESDLWHHPRKYVVPGILLSLAVLVGAQPGILPVLLVGLTLEAVVLLFLCFRGKPLL